MQQFYANVSHGKYIFNQIGFIYAVLSSRVAGILKLKKYE